MEAPDITIVGAGPAGMTAALFLAQQEVPVTLIDKEKFPRDKICGDCLGGYTLSVLKQIGEDVLDRFVHFKRKVEGYGVHFFGPDQQRISSEAVNDIDQKLKEVAFCKRVDFDNFLMEEIKKHEAVKVIEGSRVSSMKHIQHRIELYNSTGELMSNCKLLILATGSNQSLVHLLTRTRTPKKNMAAGVRAYFSGIRHVDPPGYLELHFLKELAPGYLWIFPLPDNEFNVGIGMRSDIISRKRLDLKDMFYDCIRNHDYLSTRFKDAEQISDLKGFPLALGGSRKRISGESYLLAGDAANLIEPLFGEGIGHAMYSGKFAAEHAMQCLRNDTFTSTFNKKYDQAVYKKLGSTLRFSKLMHQAAFYPGLINVIFNKVSNNPRLELQLAGIINGNIPKSRANGLKFFRNLIFR